MFQNTINPIFQQRDIAYLKWLFPKNKSTLVNGLIFIFITITALSLVDHFYYSESYYSALKPAQSKPFGIDRYFRLIFVPLFNIGMIFLAKSTWCNSMKRLELIAGLVIFASLFTFLATGWVHEYYTADDFAFDALVLIIFAQTILGLTFKPSLLINGLLIFIILTYIWIDDLEIKTQIYNTTLLLLVWIPVLLGTLKLELSKRLNFKTIFQLQASNDELASVNKKVAEQKKLLKAGEKVSKLASWKASKNFRKVYYSDGVYDIYEFDKTQINQHNLFTETLRCTHRDDMEDITINIQKIMTNDNYKKSTEHRIILKDGQIKWIKTTIGAYNKNEGVIGTIQDITKDKMLELNLQNVLDELKMKNEDLQQFAYASSHDLQEPLRTITNFVTVMNKEIGSNLSSDQRMYMDFILESTGRMRNLILAILDYSRIGRNKQLEKIDPNVVVQNVLTDLSFALQESEGVVQYNDLYTIVGYKAEFATLIQNLISNALKFRRKGVPPVIHISSQTTKTHFQFKVKDNGIGIEQKYIHKIFQLFSRLHSRTTYEGTGIGLTHSKKIVELHGGTIWVESEKNKGTTFLFTITKALKVTEDEKEIALHYAH